MGRFHIELQQNHLLKSLRFFLDLSGWDSLFLNLETPINISAIAIESILFREMITGGVAYTHPTPYIIISLIVKIHQPKNTEGTTAC